MNFLTHEHWVVFCLFVSFKFYFFNVLNFQFINTLLPWINLFLTIWLTFLGINRFSFLLYHLASSLLVYKNYSYVWCWVVLLLFYWAQFIALTGFGLHSFYDLHGLLCINHTAHKITYPERFSFPVWMTFISFSYLILPNEVSSDFFGEQQQEHHCLVHGIRNRPDETLLLLEKVLKDIHISVPNHGSLFYHSWLVS